MISSPAIHAASSGAAFQHLIPGRFLMRLAKAEKESGCLWHSWEAQHSSSQNRHATAKTSMTRGTTKFKAGFAALCSVESSYCRHGGTALARKLSADRPPVTFKTMRRLASTMITAKDWLEA
jgi:hypothetical protein